MSKEKSNFVKNGKYAKVVDCTAYTTFSKEIQKPINLVIYISFY